MRAAKLPGLVAALGVVLLVVAACGTGADTGNDQGATSTAPTSETARSENSPETSTPTDSDEDLARVSEETVGADGAGDVPDDPWGKELPTGPAPTAPPAPPSDFDSDGDGMYTLDEFELAIRYRYPEYEWPPGYRLDLDKALDGMDFPEDSRIEAPGEFTFLGLYHDCAWEFTLIDASLENDQSLIDESLYQLVEFGQNKNPLSHDENGKASMRDMYERAALGDVAPLQQWVSNNCERMRPYLITPDSATPPSTRKFEDEHVLAVAGIAPTS